jgi:preprotein translocase subunit SecE
MDKANQKILTLCFAVFAFLSALSVGLLVKSLSGAFGIIAKLNDMDVIRHGFPVVFGLVLFSLLQFNKSVLVWGDEVILEIKKVIWPSRKDTVAMSIVVVVMVIISGLIVSSFDFISGYLINFMMK